MFKVKRDLKTLVFFLFFIGINLLFYAEKMPLYHEEPRRAIIANEMLLRGDYFVPTVCGENYLKKPPFQNWVILLLGKATGSITNLDARLPSVISFILTALFLFLLFDRGNQGFVASFVFLTSYITLISYANKAEPDMLFTFLTFMAYYFWMKGKSMPYFLASSLFMGVAMLTKGISPVFFYPGLFLFYLFGGKNVFKNSLKLLFHFLVSTVIPLLWLAVYSYDENINLLLSVFSSEVSSRMVNSISYVFFHIFTFPLRAFLALFPWSIVFFFIFKTSVFKNVGRERLFMSSFLILLTSFVLMTVFPGGRGRYFMPAVPFFAVVLSFLCPKGVLLKDYLKWIGLFTLFFLYEVFGFYLVKHNFVWQGGVLIVLGILTLVFIRFKYFVFDFLVVFSVFLFLFNIHGLYLYRARVKKQYKEIAKTVYSLFPDKSKPVVVDNTLKPEFVSLALNLERIMGNFVFSERVLKPSDYYLITSKEKVCRCCKLLYRCLCSKRVPAIYVYRCRQKR